MSAPDKDLHRNLMWLYGVVLGLAIKDALTAVVPLFFDGPRGPRQSFDEAFRLAVFLLVAIRFWLGSMVYYERAYFSPGAAEGDLGPGSQSLAESYRRDFLVGFFHYTLLFAWSQSIVDGPNISHYAYLILLSLVLGYDLFWWRLTPASGRPTIRVWTFVNVATLMIGALIYLTIDAVFSDTIADIFAEPAALLIVVAASLIDIAALIRGQDLFARMFKQLGDGHR